jgi:cytidylate kinase
MIITIDGPVASGKSTVAKLLAERLGFYSLNTGLLYRAVAYVLKTFQGVKTLEQLAVAPATIFSFIPHITYTFHDGRPLVCYQRTDITPFLKLPEFDQPASVVSANPFVRAQLLGVQHAIGKQYDIVADGRDCGSVVYPDADYKFFLTASLEVRAARMAEYLHQKTGKPKDLAAARKQIVQRDKRDSERAVAPLRVPDGAIVIDNGLMTIEQTVQKILRYIEQ